MTAPSIPAAAVEAALDPDALKAALTAYDACFPDAGFVSYDGFLAGLRTYLHARPAVEDNPMEIPAEGWKPAINPSIPEPARSQIAALIAERDEARRDTDVLAKNIAELYDDINKATAERDEARRELEIVEAAVADNAGACAEFAAERDEARRERDAWQSAFNGADKLIAALTAERDALAAIGKACAEVAENHASKKDEQALEASDNAQRSAFYEGKRTARSIAADILTLTGAAPDA